jgi:hypothetical protein
MFSRGGSTELHPSDCTESSSPGMPGFDLTTIIDMNLPSRDTISLESHGTWTSGRRHTSGTFSTRFND